MPTLKKVILSSNVTFDFVHLEETDTAINQNIFVNQYIPQLNDTSRALISFDNGDTNCEGISTLSFGYSFSVYRIRDDELAPHLVAAISTGYLSVIDYNVSNQHNYTYYVYKEDDNYSTDANVSNTVNTNWWDWSITGLTRIGKNQYRADVNNIWLFELNVESAETVSNIDQTVYNNLTRYPRMSVGKGNYKTGGLTCLIGSVSNGKYYDTSDLYDAFVEFCGSSAPKLLKDRKGHKMLVGINSLSNQIADETREQASTITFTWTEVGSTDNLIITE